VRVLLKQPYALPEQEAGVDRPIDLHRRLPGYAVTPLVEAPDVAADLGIGKVLVKNETSRFGLPSFKVLGASWATYATLRDRLGQVPDGPLTWESLRSWAAPLLPLTLVAATDGNHGRAVARVASWFGFQARIYVPNFVSARRRRGIEREGAELVTVDDSYDVSVDAAMAAAAQPGTLLISDTARDVSDIVPRRVAAGYGTAFVEAEEQLSARGEDSIDAVGIQAGVGGLASAATVWARRAGRMVPAQVVVTEPEGAASVFTALAAGEPRPLNAYGNSVMSVLQCGTVSFTAFPILNAGVSCCLAIEDHWALAAVSALRSCGVETGPSGAAGLAGLMAALGGAFAVPVKEHLGLGSHSRLLVVATEAPAAAGPE
jgi:diaminopropionate ammonia-lyase